MKMTCKRKIYKTPEQVYMGRYICLFVRLSVCLSVSLWDYQNAKIQLEEIATLIIFLSTRGPLRHTNH